MNSLKNFGLFFSAIKSVPISLHPFRNAGYKSALSLQNLYPGSSLKITTPSKVILIVCLFIYFLTTQHLA